MSSESTKIWFLRVLSRDLFIISAVTWVVLFVLENVKSGIVSNYVSLPHAALLVAVFAIIALIFQPAIVKQGPSKLSKKDYIALIIVSLLLIILIPVMTDASALLTVFLVFVTVIALWVGSLIMQDNK